MVLDKNALLMRDGEGNCLPMEMHCELLKGTIKVLPLRQGDINEFTALAKDGDNAIIGKFLKEPLLTEDEIKEMPNIVKREIAMIILQTTGADREQLEEAMKKGLEKLKQEDVTKN